MRLVLGEQAGQFLAPQRAVGTTAHPVPPHRVRAPKPTRRSATRCTLFVAVTGIAGTIRTKRGAIFVPRSGWAARNAAKASGSNTAPSRSANAAITWSPATGSGTAYTATAAASPQRARMFSIIAAARFSLSTRSRSSVRPAK